MAHCPVCRGPHKVGSHKKRKAPAKKSAHHKGGGAHELMIYQRTKGATKWNYVGSYSPSDGKKQLAVLRKELPWMTFRADKVRFNERTGRWVKTR